MIFSQQWDYFFWNSPEEDSKRKSSPLVIAEGAVVIDSSEIDVEQVVLAALTVLRERGASEELLAKAN